ncbi:MFS transporter [Pseudodesulfovibrio pelocollis]|uniref:MFS transporter n=1 Tax=Pseudodesulfovibrio pelocollis TaxID=3051432 RepID=UPI00255B257E|nr:MFS transporter [Pseudodesulfovibrio sp. SB368]
MSMAFDEHIRRRRLLIPVLASGFLVTLGVGLFSFALPLVSLDARIGGAWLGSGFAGFYLVRLLAAPLAGAWADRQGARRPLLIASAIGVCAPLIHFLHPSLTALYATQFLLGVASGMFRPVGMAALGGMVERERLSHWFAVHALLFNLAMFIGPLVGSALYLGRRVEPVLFGLGLCMVAALLVVGLFMPGGRVERREEDAPDRDGPTGPWDWVAVLLAVGGRTLGLGLVAAFYPIHLAMVLGHKGLVLGALFALPSLAVCLGLPVAARLFGHGCRASLTLAGMTVSAVCLFAIGTSVAPWQLALFGIVMGLGAALSLPASMALASGLSPRQGRVFGAAHVASGIGFVLGPLLGGLVIQATHQVGAVFQAAALIGLLSCLPLLARVLMDRMHYGRGAALTLVGLCALVLAGAGSSMIHAQARSVDPGPPGLHRYTDVAMGTVVNLTLATDSRRSADLAARRCIALMRELQADFDHRNPEGSVGRINRAAGKNWVEPTPRAQALIRRAVDFARASGGAFDPTIGALTTSPFYYMMDEAVARSRRGLVDYRLVRFEEAGGRIRLEREGMALDLGGIAKGAIIDAAVRLLRAEGIEAGIVEAGGDFHVFGDRDWTVGIRHPRAEAVHRTLTVRNQAVCGSGDYEQFVVRETSAEAIMRHHIIDPATMEPARASFGVTVVADSAETADALATALFIMGPEAGTALLAEQYPGTAALWFGPDLSVIETAGFPR